MSHGAFSAGNHRSDSLVLRVWRSECDILAKRDIEKFCLWDVERWPKDKVTATQS